MDKDGTVYLALIDTGNTKRWELIHWGFAAMVTPTLYCWCNQVGIGMKISKIHKYVRLSDLTKDI